MRSSGFRDTSSATLAALLVSQVQLSKRMIIEGSEEKGPRSILMVLTFPGMGTTAHTRAQRARTTIEARQNPQDESSRSSGLKIGTACPMPMIYPMEISFGESPTG